MSVRSAASTFFRWFDTHAISPEAYAAADPMDRKVEWFRVAPFIVMHAVCLTAIWTGASPVAVAVCVALYLVRMFAITGFYHRYFSHRTFRTSRAFQFVMGVFGASAVQRGPLWWAAHHRRHHRLSDMPGDPHSAKLDGFWWSHMGWITSRSNFPTDFTAVPDLAKYPELVFLNRFDTLVPFVLALSMFALGATLNAVAPGLGTSGWQMLVWGFFISTVALFHGTCTINSLAHKIGRRRYQTTDDSRNSLTLALITLGEGWHNNHHHFPGATRQGFRWYEVDFTYYTLKALSFVGVVWDLRPVPKEVVEEADRPARAKPPVAAPAPVVELPVFVPPMPEPVGVEAVS
jgi:stearoyl-CoA desaturase (delta-9 desaturase)